MQPQSPWDPGRDAIFLLHFAARLVMRRADGELRGLGLGSGYVPVLRALADGSAQTQTGLAAHARIEQPTMAQLLNRMERDGLVRRTPNPDDARSILYSLTPRALAKAPAARAVLIEHSRAAVAGLTSTDIAQLTRILEHIIANLEPEIDRAPDPPATSVGRSRRTAPRTAPRRRSAKATPER